MESHLLQMRGLKQRHPYYDGRNLLSHLLQMRGLKPSSTATNGSDHRRIFYRCVD